MIPLSDRVSVDIVDLRGVKVMKGVRFIPVNQMLFKGLS